MQMKSRGLGRAFSSACNSPRLKKLVASSRLGRLLVASLMLGLSLAIVLFVKTVTHTSFVKLPTLAQQKAGLEIYDRNDKLVTVVQRGGNRKPIALSAMSPYIRQAVIAIEDHNFYHHMGIDPLGVSRAMLKNAMARQWVEGGSTITQQLMKTMYFSHDDRTARRKILEAFMAIDVETCYSKDKILETYLNQVYFGRGAYGIERAANVYFNKKASQLTVPESAFLAALIKAPSDLGQASNLKRATARQMEVLKGMEECSFLNSEALKRAKAVKLTFKPGPVSHPSPYYVNHVVGMVKDEIGEDELFARPLKVYTNLDVGAQRKAEQALSSGVIKAPYGVNQGALVSIDLETGGVIALVGGVGDYARHQWDRAVYPHTAGSAFKPFVYLAALINGNVGPSTVLNDAPIAVPTGDGKAYSPANYDGEFRGLMTVRDAIAQSRNVCAVQVGQETGISKVIDVARKAGINAEMDSVPSLALGTCAVTPLEMANAYATLARGGERVEPQFIRRITLADGRLVKEYKNARQTTLPAEHVYQIVDALEDVVKVGTGKRAGLPGVAVAGKTGTADQSKDVWFVGFTPDVVTAVWAGNDDNNALRGGGITGGTIAAGIWSKYMTGYYKDHAKPEVAFIDPAEPLTTSLPFYAALPEAIGDATEEVVETVDEVVKPAQKQGKSFLRKLTEGIKNLF